MHAVRADRHHREVFVVLELALIPIAVKLIVILLCAMIAGIAGATKFVP